MRKLSINQETQDFVIHALKGDVLDLEVDGERFRFEVFERQASKLVLRDGQGELVTLWTESFKGKTSVTFAGQDFLVEETQNLTKRSQGGGGLEAPMPGKVFKLLVKVGDRVAAGDTLLILEAMKMEHAIRAPHAGLVKRVLYQVGELVQGGASLLELEESK